MIMRCVCCMEKFKRLLTAEANFSGVIRLGGVFSPSLAVIGLLLLSTSAWVAANLLASSYIFIYQTYAKIQHREDIFPKQQQQHHHLQEKQP